METMMQSAVCLLEQAAEKFKNKTVFEDKDGSISFEELREKSRIIGSELIKRVETGRKCPVIVYLPKSIKSIISFMGSLYSASPYVPIDYAIPMARMEKTVENQERVLALEHKAGDKSSPQELLALAEKILSGEVPPFCPHGRPCVLKLTRKELEKQFGRIV